MGFVIHRTGIVFFHETEECPDCGRELEQPVFQEPRSEGAAVECSCGFTRWVPIYLAEIEADQRERWRMTPSKPSWVKDEDPCSPRDLTKLPLGKPTKWELLLCYWARKANKL